MRFIEADSSGNIFNVAEVMYPGGTPSDDDTNPVIDTMREASEANGNTFVVLTDDEVVDPETHLVDKGKVRLLTNAEKDERARVAQEQLVAPASVYTQEDVDKIAQEAANRAIAAYIESQKTA